MIKQLWWVALVSGLACSSSGQGSAGGNGDGARTRAGAGSGAQANTTQLPPGDPAEGANAADEWSLLETATGLVVQIERDGQQIQRSCGGSCADVCKGCLLEACQLSATPGLCNTAADVCENRCNACLSANGEATCDAVSCAGDLSCYFVTLGVPEEFRDVVRGVSGEVVSPQPVSSQPVSPEPGTSDPERAATPADPGAGEPSSGEGNGSGAY
jgi:hypothetical protein